MSLLTAALLVAGGVFVGSGAASKAPATTAVGAAQMAAAPGTYPVGLRKFNFARGKERPLPTMVWYPAKGRRSKGKAQSDATPAAGTFPLLLWSHGFYSNPQMQESVTRFLAESGYVVVAPAYPFTKKDGPKFNKLDVPNQATDASYVISQMIEPGNPLAASIDADRMGAIGHSGGATTTNWLFTGKRDPRLKVGVMLAGRPTSTYQGEPVPLLFVHGDKDPVVAYSQGRESYGKDPWPKAFLTIRGGEHGAGTGDAELGHTQAMATILDFLLWGLNGDDAARLRLQKDATLAGVTQFEQVGVYSTNTTTSTTTSSAAAAATASATGKALERAGSAAG
ncbi:alpha/beta hydrolase [Dactylosporangium sp. NPDC005572]|uniref:alpha/beta hydrolase family protein n=1 Tax=Dactylosporangium sp. NPDC005572 TaxID=3156889 RepID=UPI0033B7D9A0